MQPSTFTVESSSTPQTPPILSTHSDIQEPPHDLNSSTKQLELLSLSSSLTSSTMDSASSTNNNSAIHNLSSSISTTTATTTTISTTTTNPFEDQSNPTIDSAMDTASNYEHDRTVRRFRTRPARQQVVTAEHQQDKQSSMPSYETMSIAQLIDENSKRNPQLDPNTNAERFFTTKMTTFKMANPESHLEEDDDFDDDDNNTPQISLKKDAPSSPQLISNQSSLASSMNSQLGSDDTDTSKSSAPEKKCLQEDYLILEILGKGGQGRVATFLSKNTHNIIALKEFFDTDDFEREVGLYRFVKSNPEIKEYVNLMLEESVEKQSIQLQMGSCNLYELYLKLKASNLKNQWSEHQLICIYNRLLQGTIAFRKENFYHGDIKPQNIMLFPLENAFNMYVVKYIDLGAAGTKCASYYEFFSEYFAYPKYLHRVLSGSKQTLTEEEITASEVYALFRTMWLITCADGAQSQEFNRYKGVVEDEVVFEAGIKAIDQQYPKLASILLANLQARGNIEILENDSNALTLEIRQLSEFHTLTNGVIQQKYMFDKANSLKVTVEMKDEIQQIIAQKGSKFINTQSSEQLEELFEVFYRFGLDQRALEIFNLIEPDLLRTFEKYMKENENKTGIDFDSKSILSKIRIVRESAYLLYEAGETERGRVLNQLLIDVFSSGPLKNEKQATLQSMHQSLLLHNQGQVSESLKIAKESYRKYKTLLKGKWESMNDGTVKQDTDIVFAQICQFIGHLYIEISSYSNAVMYLNYALEVFQNIQKQRDETGCSPINGIDSYYCSSTDDVRDQIQVSLIKLSKANERLKHTENAMKYICQALELGHQISGERENKQTAQCLNIKAKLLTLRKEYPEALKLQKKCLTIRLVIHNHNDHRSISNCLSSIALILANMNEWGFSLAKQEESHQMVLRIYSKSNPNHPGIAKSLKNFGLIYMQKGDLEKAEQYFAESLEKCVGNSDIHAQIEMHKKLEHIYNIQKKTDKLKAHQKAKEDLKVQLKELKKINIDKETCQTNK